MKRINRLVQGLPVQVYEASSISNKSSDDYFEKFDDKSL